MIFLGILIIIVALGGFPVGVRTALLLASGVIITILAYLSSVTYCSNCKKMIDDTDHILP